MREIVARKNGMSWYILLSGQMAKLVDAPALGAGP